MADKNGKDVDVDVNTTVNSMPEQVEDKGDDAPETPDPEDAGEGKDNSAAPIQDEARPDNLNTMGW